MLGMKTSSLTFGVTVLAILGSIASIVGVLFIPQLKLIPSNQAEDTLARIRRTKHLKVGYIPYYDISSREAQSGEVRGFLVDVIYKIAEELGVPEENLEFVETDWQNFGHGLQKNKYDLSIAGTFITPEREQVVSFTEPLFYLGNGALVRTDDHRFRSINDFNRENITVAVVQGEQGEEYARKHLKKPELKTVAGSDLSLACLEVESGRADAALSDQYILKLYARNNTNVRDALADNPYYVLPVAWAVRKEDASWLSYLNSRIAMLRDSGWIRRLQAKYEMIPWAKETSYQDHRVASSGDSALELLWFYLAAFAVGLFYTLLVSLFSIVLGTVLGSILGLILASRKAAMRWLRRLVSVYVYIFLAIPSLVLIIILYYNGYVTELNSVTVAIIALGLNLSPFAAKIIASGIVNIPPKYLEAAKAFGYSDREIALRFKLPLVSRNSLQPLLVQWFTTVKLSSLASVIGVTEVLHRSQQVIRETYRTEQAYLVLVLCYMLVVIPIAVSADRFESIATRREGGV